MSFGALQQRRAPITQRVIDRWNAAIHTITSCVLCHRFGVQASHSNMLRGKSQKADPWFQAALCPECHHAIDNGTDLSQLERREIHFRANSLTLGALIAAGTLILADGPRLP